MKEVIENAMVSSHEVILIDETKAEKETINVSFVGSWDFENIKLTGLSVDSDTGNLEIYTKDIPKLSIPKGLVDELSKVYEFEEGYDFDGFILDHVALDNIEEKKLSEYAVEHGLVVYAYLNPLTRPFVEVVE